MRYERTTDGIDWLPISRAALRTELVETGGFDPDWTMNYMHDTSPFTYRGKIATYRCVDVDPAVLAELQPD